jgi:hypothetical protein
MRIPDRRPLWEIHALFQKLQKFRRLNQTQHNIFIKKLFIRNKTVEKGSFLDWIVCSACPPPGLCQQEGGAQLPRPRSPRLAHHPVWHFHYYIYIKQMLKFTFKFLFIFCFKYNLYLNFFLSIYYTTGLVPSTIRHRVQNHVFIRKRGC